MLDSKKQLLNITLTEPIVFLRSSDPSGRLRPDPNVSPTLVRGILNLNVLKPIGISSIEVELAGVSTLNPPIGIGSRRVDLPEKRQIYSSTVTVFCADQVPYGRRPASVGPGLSTANSNNDGDDVVTTLLRSPSLLRRRSERRMSTSVPPDLDPTPPYTYVNQFPTPIRSRLGARVENPARAPEELRQALRNGPDRQVHQNGSIPASSRSHSIDCSLPNSATQSNASRTSNDSFHRENDMGHTDPTFEGDTSFRSTVEESPHILSDRGLSPGSSSRESQSHTRTNSRDSSNTPTSRSRLHFSLSSVLDAVMEVTSRAPSKLRGVAEERERGRTRVRILADEQSGATTLGLGGSVAGTGNGSQLGADSPHLSGRTEHREHHLLGLGRALGLERHHEKEKDGEQKSKERGEGWWEFKPGTYSYPIFFLLPPDLPPTLSVPHGSLDYVIKAVAHRPGTFTPKLSCHVPLIVIPAPATGYGDGSGDLGPLVVQRQWEGKLAYSFGLSSRLFLLGSQRHLETAVNERVRTNTEPQVEAEVEARAEATNGTVMLDLTLSPLEKVKIWRLGVVVDQCIRYVDEGGTLFRHNKRQVRLLEMQDACPAEELSDLVVEEEQAHKNKHRNKEDVTQIPLLPTPISPHRSPLLRYVSPSTDPSILAGPGPYTLSISLGLPGCNDPSGDDRGLHFTVKQRGSNVRVEHSMQITVRVEKVGDEGTNVHEEGEKKRLFDITVRTPITILSCRCVPEYQTLPRYSRITEDSLQNSVACACQASAVRPTERGHRLHEVETHPGHSVTTPNPTSSRGSEDRAGHSLVHRQANAQRNRHRHSRSSSSRARGGDRPSPLTMTVHAHPPSPARQTPEAGYSHGQHPHGLAHSQTPNSTPLSSRPPSPLARHERLAAGLGSDAGDAPPAYESIASGF